MTQKKPSNTQWSFTRRRRSVPRGWEKFPYLWYDYERLLKVNDPGVREASLGPDTEKGFLFLKRLKLARRVLVSGFIGSAFGSALCVVILLILSGCSTIPESTVVIKDGVLLVCVEGKCYKAGASESSPESTSP